MNNNKISRGSQKNFRETPKVVLKKLDNFSNDDFLVTTVKKISAAQIVAGDYSHIGISLENGQPSFPSKQIPSQLIGKFSRYNSQGFELKRKDLPKVTKSYSLEVPNYGDWSNGSHTVTWSREVYVREFLAPEELELEIELLGEEANSEHVFIFRFTIAKILKKKHVLINESHLIKNKLFFNLNLLQECVRAVDVFPSAATRVDYLKSLYVHWEILPPGERDATIARIITGVKNPAIKQKVTERYDFLVSLKPQDFVFGVSGLRRYFGAKFAEDFVAFEHLEYGNAMYVMFENWQKLSKMTRPELINTKRRGFERIVHKKGWETKLVRLLTERKLKKAA